MTLAEQIEKTRQEMQKELLREEFNRTWREIFTPTLRE